MRKFYARYIMKQGNKYLVENSLVNEVLEVFREKQAYFNEYANLTVKPYTGKKFREYSWIVEG